MILLPDGYILVDGTGGLLNITFLLADLYQFITSGVVGVTNLVIDYAVVIN